MKRASVGKVPAYYLTPHGVQEIEGIEDLESADGRVEIPTSEGESLIIVRVVFR